MQGYVEGEGEGGKREEEGRKEGWRRKTNVSLLWIQYKKSCVSDNNTDRRIANIANKSVVVILMNESETHYLWTSVINVLFYFPCAHRPDCMLKSSTVLRP